MTPFEPRTQAAVDAALGQIMTTVGLTTERVCNLLGTMALAATRTAQRDELLAAQFDLSRGMSVFHRVFKDTLSERVRREAEPAGASPRPRAVATDWQSLTLVDDFEVEERMSSDRLSQLVAHESENERRELAALVGGLLRSGTADEERNPLRPEVIGHAIYRAVEAVSAQPETRKTLARELGGAIAKSMVECYRRIVADLRDRGIVPVTLTVRTFEGPGSHMHGINTGYQTGTGELHRSGGLSQAGSLGAAGQPNSRGGGIGRADAGFGAGSGYGYAASGKSPAAGRYPQGERAGSGHAASGRAGLGARPAPASLSAQADAELMTLLRRLTSVASHPGVFDHVPVSVEPGPSGAGSFAGTLPSGSPLMAVNLIRAHREELMRASPGHLDHMVIDVVGSLFDQILSDPRVPPQMARQIARLQLPVLRVALHDSSFFSSRRHPVRRFVNRIGSLGCAFDQFDDGPGREFLARVGELVQEIVEGDFDQIALYDAKLGELEAFIGEQTQNRMQRSGTAATLETKESELRVQQRYMLQLQAALAPVALPAYLREFLAQVWSQALVLAVRRDGKDSERAQRFRRAGREVVLSVQPKGSPVLRKKFLMQLPGLMKDLQEGIALIGWPDAAQKAFFAQLLPAHAESLKGEPLSELDYNMLGKQLEGVFALTVPGTESLSVADVVTQEESAAIELRFSADEAREVGLVQESTVDWSGQVDIEVASGDAPATSEAAAFEDTQSDPSTPLAAGLGLDLDISVDRTPAEPPEPTRGGPLFDHVRLGFAYQMHLKDQWQKVRLTYVSPGRSFFVFTRGRKHQETISMTARMLARMCETGRMRAVESAYLLERATHRARKQLAALKATAASPH